MTIIDLLERNSLNQRGEVALVEINPEVEDTRRLTWREYDLVQQTAKKSYRREITWGIFNEKANRFAAALISRGIKKGDKVAILLMNCLEWLPIYFGILKAGAIVVPLNFRYSAEEIRYCLDLADVNLLVFGPEFAGRVGEIADLISINRLLLYVGDGCPPFAESYMALTADCDSSNINMPLTEDDYAAIYFSSGTTGFPKAILHRHRALLHAAKVEQNHHHQTHDDVFLCIPPLYHTGAKMHWFGSLISGSKAVLLRGTKPHFILDAVSKEKCTIVWLLVPWAQDILNEIDAGKINLSDYNLSQWRLMHIGAQPVPPTLIKHWFDYFPDHEYDTNYGLSESIGPGALHLGIGNVHKVGAIGVPGYGWQMRIVDENDNDVKDGEVGELLLKGDGVMVCYFNDPEATDAALKGGWLHTGDMTMRDEDGFVFLVDRKKDMVITGGENLYPVQIENFIRGYFKVSDVAVIGLPDNRLGEIAAAVIQIKEGYTCTEEEIEEFCKGMPRYKRPRKIIFADVPRNATGKIEKPKLRKMYGAEHLVMEQIGRA